MKDWRVDWSAGVTLRPRLLSGYYFDFPGSPGHINMLTTSLGPRHAPPKFISLEFKIKPKNPVYYALGDNPGDPPPSMRFYVQRWGDDYSGNGDMQFYRWWSNPVHFELGSITTAARAAMIAPVKPDQWSSVMGKPGTANIPAFNAAFKDINRVGVTFGGHFFGHGVCLTSGMARFILFSLKLS